MSDENTAAAPAAPTDTAQLVAATVAQTVAAAAPEILAGVAGTGAIANPNAALALQLAPIALQTMQSALQLAQAGAMTPAQLAAMWAQITAGVQAAHTQWAAMNMPTMPAAPAPVAA